MEIKHPQELVADALRNVKTISPEEALKLNEENKCNLIDIRDKAEVEKLGKIENSLGVKETHEYAVMIDTFKPLSMTDLTKEIEDKEYTFSWAK